MTYKELYSTAICKLCLDQSEIDDYRPASELFIKELKTQIPNAIVIWLKTGEKVIYIDKADRSKEE